MNIKEEEWTRIPLDLCLPLPPSLCSPYSSSFCARPCVLCSLSSRCECRKEPAEPPPFVAEDPCRHVSSPRLVGHGEGPPTPTPSRHAMTQKKARRRMEESPSSEREKRLQLINPEDYVVESSWFRSDAGTEEGEGEARWVTFGRVEETAGSSMKAQRVFILPHL